MHPAHVLACHLEPLLADRRVAYLGAYDPSLVALLVERGARVVHVYDPELPAAEAARMDGDVNIAPIRALDLGLRDGGFELVLAPDLALLGDPESVLTRVRRLIGTRGVALVGCRNEAAGPEWLPAPTAPMPAPTYRAFYDLCAAQFVDVRMLALVPFAAYAVAELGPEHEPAIAFDASLTDAPEPPEWFLALLAQREGGGHGLEAFDLVQLPREALSKAGAGSAATVADLEARLTLAEQKRGEAEARAGEAGLRADRQHADVTSALEELRRLREKMTKLPRELEDERLARRRLEEERDKEKGELGELRERRLSLEAELIEARTQLATPGARGGVPIAEAQRVAEELAHALAECTELRERAAQQGRLELELRQRFEERERELAASLLRAKHLEDRLEHQLAEDSSRSNVDQETMTVLTQHARAAEALAERLEAELGVAQRTHEHEVRELENALRARGAELRGARAELERRERMLRELVAELEVHGGAMADPRLELLANELEQARGERDRLAHEAARREASLQTAAWRVAELERQLSSDSPPVASEVDGLRRALLQEHERASGLERQADLGVDGRLRAALAERDTLIAQLSAELSERSRAVGG